MWGSTRLHFALGNNELFGNYEATWQQVVQRIMLKLMKLLAR